MNNRIASPFTILFNDFFNNAFRFDETILNRLKSFI